MADGYPMPPLCYDFPSALDHQTERQGQADQPGTPAADDRSLTVALNDDRHGLSHEQDERRRRTVSHG